MVSIFDDEAEEVGSEIEAYCTKCKADTTHVIISKYEDEIRRVQCNPCGDLHSFRRPRGEAEEDPPEPGVFAPDRPESLQPRSDGSHPDAVAVVGPVPPQLPPAPAREDG